MWREKGRDDRSGEAREHIGPSSRYTEYVTMIASQERNLTDCQNTEFKDAKVHFLKPTSAKHGVEKFKYCKFHKSRGHVTEDCVHLNDEIKMRIREGRLSNYAKRSEAPRHDVHETKRIEEDRSPDHGLVQFTLCISRTEYFLDSGEFATLSP